MSAQTVVFILSSNYSGSHLLAQALGAHPACADVGELGNLAKFRRRREGNVSGTRAAYATSELFQGLESEPESNWHRVLLSRLRAEEPAVRVLVDNSKRVDWLRRVGSTAIDARCVHLLRDPRALALRWQETFAGQGAAGRIRRREARRRWRDGWRILTGSELQVYAYRWLRENAVITDFLAASGLPTTVISYESLVGDPAATLAALMPALGLTYDPAQLRYGEARQFGTRKTEWDARGRNSEWAPDLRWRTALDAEQQACVTELAPLQNLLRGLGQRMTNQGLRPIPVADREQHQSESGSGSHEDGR